LTRTRRKCIDVLDELLEEFRDVKFWKGKQLSVPGYVVRDRNFFKKINTVGKAVQRINFLLLRCFCALRMLRKGRDLDDEKVGLGDALEALHDAEGMGLVYIVCKCKIYVGIYLMRMGRWEDALTFYDRSTVVSVQGWDGRMEDLKRDVFRGRAGLRPLRKLNVPRRLASEY
jgi:hypothetical protein